VEPVGDLNFDEVGEEEESAGAEWGSEGSVDYCHYCDERCSCYGNVTIFLIMSPFLLN
jgi:hypothetical protein